MPDYVRRARALAARLRDEQVCEIHPLVPQVNAFQVILRGTVDDLKQRNRDFAVRERVWLFNAFFESSFEGRAIAEIVIGDAADDYSDDEACQWLRRFQAMPSGRPVPKPKSAPDLSRLQQPIRCRPSMPSGPRRRKRQGLRRSGGSAASPPSR